MTVNPIVPNKGNPPQVSGTQGQSGDEAFQSFANKSDGYTEKELEEATRGRTRLTRTRGANQTKKSKTSLLLVADNEEFESDEPVYRTVMVDGQLFTLRLIAVA